MLHEVRCTGVSALNIARPEASIDPIAMFCQSCGKELSDQASFCPSCGRPTAASPQYGQAPPPAQPQYGTPMYAPGQPRTRPTGVTILAVLTLLGGIFFLIFAAIVLAVGTMFGFLPGAILGGVGAALIVFALISFAVTYGMWTGTKWAWWLGIIVAILDVISIISFNVIGLIIGLVMLYYLTRPHVKLWFHEEHNRI